MPVQSSHHASDEDPLSGFLAECVVVAPGRSVAAKAMYEAFVAWCEANAKRPWKEASFGRALEQRGYVKTAECVRRYLGIALAVDGRADHEARSFQGSEGGFRPALERSVEAGLHLEGRLDPVLKLVPKPSVAAGGSRVEDDREVFEGCGKQPKREVVINLGRLAEEFGPRLRITIVEQGGARSDADLRPRQSRKLGGWVACATAATATLVFVGHALGRRTAARSRQPQS